MRQSCLVRHIYTRTILNLPAVDTGKQTVRSVYIYTRTKPNRLLIMKIGIVAIALTLFHNHALVHKELVKRHKDIASTLVTYTCVTLFQCRYHIGIALYNRLPKPFSNASRCCCSISSVSGKFLSCLGCWNT